MTPNPIRKVLSTLAAHQVRYLLMGGQACVLYGAAEFSRDTDLNVLADTENLGRLSAALHELQATCIAVPPWDWAYLDRGHALHFRCAHPDAEGMRIDVIAVLRGVAAFEELWARRTTVEVEDGLPIELMALPDLVLAKKTQRDKDWPMIRRLVEAHYARHRASPVPEQVEFWLREARTPALLTEVAQRYPDRAAAQTPARPLLALADAGRLADLAAALEAEEAREREADRAYWVPLLQELHQLRHRRRNE